MSINTLEESEKYIVSKAEKDLVAVILCGGQSKRMGGDKSLIDYHGLPQGHFMFELLSKLNIPVYISCRKDQVDQFLEMPLIVDQYDKIGPMGGLLSAFEKLPNHAIFLVGCDYPLIEEEDLNRLLQRRNQSKVLTMLTESPSQIEPALCIYEPYLELKVRQEYHNKNFSLRQLIEGLEHEIVFPSHPDNLMQANTKSEMNEIKRILKLRSVGHF